MGDEKVKPKFDKKKWRTHKYSKKAKGENIKRICSKLCLFPFEIRKRKGYNRLLIFNLLYLQLINGRRRGRSIWSLNTFACSKEREN